MFRWGTGTGPVEPEDPGDLSLQQTVTGPREYLDYHLSLDNSVYPMIGMKSSYCDELGTSRYISV